MIVVMESPKMPDPCLRDVSDLGRPHGEFVEERRLRDVGGLGPAVDLSRGEEIETHSGLSLVKSL